MPPPQQEGRGRGGGGGREGEGEGGRGGGRCVVYINYLESQSAELTTGMSCWIS